MIREHATISLGRTICPTTTATSVRRATMTRKTTTSTRRARAICCLAAVGVGWSVATRKIGHYRLCLPESTETSRYSASTRASARHSSMRSCDMACRPRMPSTRSGSSVIYEVCVGITKELCFHVCVLYRANGCVQE